MDVAIARRKNKKRRDGKNGMGWDSRSPTAPRFNVIFFKRNPIFSAFSNGLSHGAHAALSFARCPRKSAFIVATNRRHFPPEGG
jgi:hypothetical protein